MQFTKRLRDPIARGEVTTSVRIWKRTHAKVGGRYRCGDGFVTVDSIDEITLEDVTPRLARACGFEDVEDMMGVAKHGSGDRVYRITFRYSET